MTAVTRRTRNIRTGEEVDPTQADQDALQENFVRLGYCAGCDYPMEASTIFRFYCPGCGDVFTWS